MKANKIKYIYRDEDGTLDYEILELTSSATDSVDIVSIESYYDESEG